MTDSAPPAAARLRRTSSLSLMDGGSALLGSFAHKFQSKRAPPTAALPPSHGHGHRRKSMVIYYSSAGPSAAAVPAPLGVREDRASGRSSDGDASADGGADGPPRSSRRLSRAHTLDELDGFDVESAMANYAASFGPRPPSAAGPPSRRSSTLRRMSLRFSHGRSAPPSAPASTSASASAPAPSRADAKGRKYAVDWRDDRAAPCCQLCFAAFTTLSRRRHHCRLCGELVCGACSPDQAALVDRFADPKRACNACLALLEALAAARDPRVLRVEGAHHRYPAGSSLGSAASSVSASATSVSAATATVSTTAADAPGLADAGTDAPARLLAPPTPHYRDRLAEVRRVMAAGDKSRRRGSHGRAGVMCVVPAAWVRAWLAFTEGAASDADAAPLSASSASPSSPPSPDAAARASSSSPGASAPAPGPINNWQLLEFAQGRLVRRAGTERDDGPTADASDDDRHPLGFQLLTPEVFDVFQRLYGGGPAIRVDMATSSEWVVDVRPVLAVLPAGSVSPAVERALLQRHASASLSASAGVPVSPSPLAAADAGKGSPTASSSGATVLSDDDGTAALEPALAVSTVRTPPTDEPKPLGGDLQATARSPSAATATAASAFALAMKQARLNAQRAIDERARGA